MRRVFLCVLHFPNHTLSMSQSAYSGSPLVFLWRFLDLLWMSRGQLRLISGLTPACTCFQSPQLLPKSTVPGWLRGKFSVPLAAEAIYPFTQGVCDQLWFFTLPLLIGLPPLSAPYPDKKGESDSLWGLICSFSLGRGKDTLDTNGMCIWCLLQPKPVGSCYSSSWFVCSNREVGPRLCLPQHSQAT